MLAVVLVPLLVSLLAAAFAPVVASRLRPAAAAKLLVVLALSAALALGLMLSLAGLIGVRLLVPGVRPRDWVPAELRQVVPLPSYVGVGCALLAAALFLSAVWRTVAGLVAWRRARVTSFGLPVSAGVAVVDDDAVYAYAVPGPSGRVVVSSGLRDTLPAAEFRAVIEHERSHVRHRHHVYTQLVRIAAAADPLLRPLVGTVHLAVERWADEDARGSVGSPVVVARAIALVGRGGPTSLPGLGAAGHDAIERARFLLEPPRSTGRARAWLLGLAAFACWAGAVLATHHVNTLVEVAERAAGR